ncbi:MAG: ABC transporter ATP-binding protein [Bacteroidia bacterium]|nr:ABC transporter ATP-binding protein [Bacteroidia bacterium]
MNNPIVECRSVSKKYGEIAALVNFDIDISEGEVFGIIGPDGAGKTTLFRILSSLILPDSGSATVLGHDVVKDYRYIRKSIGFMPGRFSLYQDLTVEENLNFYASVFGVNIQENYHLIKDIYGPLEPFRTRRAGKLSGGMKQKLALSCALIHKPTLLILDEPTTGVDAVSRKEFWDHLGSLQNGGMTILVSTPYMDEAQRCGRLAMIQKGRILDIGRPDEIRSRFKGILFQLTCSDRYQALLICRKSEQIGSVHAFGQSLHLTLAGGAQTEVVHKMLIDNGIDDVVIQEISPSIEDCFIQYLI